MVRPMTNPERQQIHERMDDPQNALQRYTQAIQRGPRFLEAYTELGRLYADLGFLDHASRVLQAGLEVAIPNTQEEANLHYMLGTIFQQQRNYDQAIAQFRSPQLAARTSIALRAR